MAETEHAPAPARAASPAARAGVRVYVGVPGSGKTRTMRREVHAAARTIPVMVLDIRRRRSQSDWTAAPRSLRAALVGDVAGASRAFDNGAQLVVVQTEDRATTITEAAAWATAVRPFGSVRGLAIPEAHKVFPNGPNLPDDLEELLTEWRHNENALWCDTQRCALISRTATGCARELRIYAQTDRADLDEVRRIGGPELQAQIEEAARRLDERARGGEDEPGWHVSMGLVKRPPFALERDP